MKYALIIFLTLSACAPAKKVSKLNYPTPFEFELIDTITGDKNYVYVKANEWMARTYNSSKSVIQMQDKDAGKIIGKAVMDGMTVRDPINGIYTSKDFIDYTISIDAKDGRYRAVISNFYHNGGTYIANGKTSTSRSYGVLDKPMATRISAATNKPVEDTRYYEIKNFAMQKSEAILLMLKEAMHKKEKDF